jgi:hypothetical protein
MPSIPVRHIQFRRCFVRRGARPCQVELQQLRQRVLFRNIGGPAVGGGDRGIEIAVRVGKPLRSRAGRDEVALLRILHGRRNISRVLLRG